ncbi:MAG: DUF481 domain-containing protein, partial [candidate division Zixibacteria bacterium]|nr:DUF481 domain-containing protein [candidate division Zixibacteria bacterium]
MTRLLQVALVVFIALCLSDSANAIVNMEFLRADMKPGFGGEVEFSASLRTGNTESVDLGFSAGSRYLGKRSAILFVSAVEFQERDRARFSRRAFAHIRYHHNPRNKISAEVFTQVEYDENLRLSARNLLGAGARIRFAKTEKGSAYLGIAYLLEFEKLRSHDGSPVDGEYNNLLSSYFTTQYSWLNLILKSVTYAQPHFKDFADLRILNISSLNIIVSKRFSIGFDLTMRYNSRPPDKIET